MAQHKYCDACETTYDSWSPCECNTKASSAVANPEPSEFDKLFDEIAEEYMRAG